MAVLGYNPKVTLHHFTSLDGFKGIISSKQLWLSDISSTNDPRELNLGQAMIIEAIKHLRDNDFRGENGFILSILAGKITGYLNGGRLMSCSFTRDGDSLPFWNEYAAKYTGLSLGFRPAALRAMPVRIQKIDYLNPEIQGELIDFLRQLLLPLVKKQVDLNSIDSIPIISEIVARIVHLKHNTWSFEDEIRISHAVANLDDADEVEGITFPSSITPDEVPYYSNLRQRTVNGKVVSYVPIWYGRFEKGKYNPSRALERVILGPNCELAIEEAEDMLFSNGFKDFGVIRSDCQIR